MAIIGAAAAVVGFVVVVMLLVGGGGSDPAPRVAAPSSELPEDVAPELVVQESARETEADRVRRFLEAPVWDETVVAAFVFDWDLLATADREQFRESELFNQFTARVRDRIKVDNALNADRLDSGLSLAQALAVELDLGIEIAETVPMDEPVTEWVDEAIPDEAEPEMLPAAAAELTVAEETPASEPSAVTDPVRGEPAALETEAMEESLASVEERVGEAVEAAAPIVAQDAPPAATEEAAEQSVAQTEPVAEGTAVAARFPSDRPCTVEVLNTRSAMCWDMMEAEVRGPILRVVGPGEFYMGEDGDPNAEPVHVQKIEKAFAIGTHEVSVAEFERYCALTGDSCPERRWSDGDYPVVDVTWSQAVAYTNWLTESTGAKYRLPTEAEWEYAARAGSTGLYPFGDTVSPAYARFDTGLRSISPLPNDDRTTRSNGYRLWHVAGNVREWTVDVWRERYDQEGDPGMRTIRGGSYAEPADRLRSAARSGAPVDYFDTKTGFRVVRELE
jgi:formylglycine-generating enzyme required for sulfatase activity